MYQKYDAYKDSGYDFYGHIPSHWNLEKIKFNSYVKGRQGWQNLRADEYRASGPYLVTGAHFDVNGHVSWERCHHVSEERYKRDQSIWINQSDVLITKDGTIGKVAYIYDLPDKACLNSHILLIRSSKGQYTQKYIYYLLTSECFKGFVSQRQTGTTFFGITQESIEDFPLPIPPHSEQFNITSFLDCETDKIDLMIEKQQRLIKLLEEKREAVISHAVTKGLNPDVPMKDSGVEWLGDVPEHWDVPKLKWFFTTESGSTPNTSRYEEYYQDGEIPWIRTTDLNNAELLDSPIRITQQAIDETSCSVIPINSVLVAMYGGGGTIGKHSLLKFSATINQAVCAILPSHMVIPEYLHLFVEFHRPYWMIGAEGTRKDPNISQDIVRELILTCPPKEEQQAISLNTKKQISIIELTIEKSRKSIELMQERRTALISAAVTGKIDVRDQVPQDVEEAVAS